MDNQHKWTWGDTWTLLVLLTWAYLVIDSILHN